MRRSNRTKILEEYAEFLNDESSDGYRLAQFLQEKQGDQRHIGRVFPDINPRFSFDVRVKKLPTPPPSSSPEDEIARVQNKNVDNHNITINQTPDKEKTLPNVSPLAVPLLSSPIQEISQPVDAAIAAIVVSSQRQSPTRLMEGVLKSGSDRLRRYSLKRLSHRRALSKEFDKSVFSPDFLPHICSTPQSSKQNKTSIQQNQNENNEKSVTQHHKQDDNNEKSVTQNHKQDDNNDKSEQQDHNTNKLNSFVSKIVETTLNKIDERSNLNHTNINNKCDKTLTPQTRTFTIEKPSQSRTEKTTILKTPETKIGKIRVLNNETLFGSPKITKILDKFHTREDSFTNLTKNQTYNVNKEMQWDINPQVCSNKNQTLAEITIPETQEQNLSHHMNETEALVTSLQQMKTPVVVVNQTFGTNAGITQPKSNDMTNILEQQKETAQKVEQQTQTISEENHQSHQEKEQQLNKSITKQKGTLNEKKKTVATNTTRINTDIFTDDNSSTDDEDPVPRKIFRTSSAPLDLASNSKTSNVRKKVLRRHRKNYHHQAESDDDHIYAGPPNAHVLNMQKKNIIKSQHNRKLPLNKAPNTPINGEKFASELKNQLQRLTNYEILDLRKRNSKGKIFTNLQKVNNQSRLEQEIILELNKRNIKSNEMDLPQSNITTAIDTHNNGEIDKLIYREDGVELLSETGHDTQVKLLSKSQRLSGRSSLRHFIKTTPEIVKRYKTAKDDIKKHVINESKRTLYSKGYSDLEDEIFDSYINIVPEPPTAFAETISELCIVPPPPPMELPTTSTKITRPKRKNNKTISKLNITLNEVSNEPLNELSNEPLNELSNEPLNDHANASSHEPLNRAETCTPPIDFIDKLIADSLQDRQQQQELTKNNVDIFKKPTAPASKKSKIIAQTEKKKTNGKRPRKTQKKSKEENVEEVEAESNFNASQSSAYGENSSALRRSKRNHLPNSNHAFFMSLCLKETINSIKRRQDRKKKLSMRESAIIPIASSTFGQSTSTVKKSTYNRRNAKVHSNEENQQEIPPTKSLPIITENESNDEELLHQVEQIEKPKKTKKIVTKITAASEQTPTPTKTKKISKIRASRASTQKPETTTKERKKKATDDNNDINTTIERNHIELPAAPLEHINKVIDQLRNETIIETKPIKNQESQKKKKADDNVKNTKKLKVRLQCVTKEQEKKSNKEKGTTITSDDNLTMATTSKNQNDNSKFSNEKRNDELLSWLKGLQDTQISNESNNCNMFKEMFCFAAGSLTFVDLDGIDYAFYDTENVGSNLGYLRFKPNQKRRPKTARKYDLQFIILSSEFRIFTNNEVGIFKPGDMVRIYKGQRYSMDNMTSEIGLLMIIKK